MRILITTLLVLICQPLLFGQVPQKMSYQAIVRNSNQELVTNQLIGLEISISNGNNDILFSESHLVTSNSNGLVSLIIGEGQTDGLGLEVINWALGPYYIEVNVDPSGGENYIISGVSELVSVPYALFALKSADPKGDSDWVEDILNDLVYTENNIQMHVGGTVPFRVNTAAPIGVPRLEAGTNDGIGIQGNSNIGYGVRGQAIQGVGVLGTAMNFGDGVQGEAQNGNGVEGKSVGGFGVEGTSTLGIGIYGFSEENIGIRGESDFNVAVHGLAFTDEGVLGESALSYGVHGFTEGNNVSGVFGDGMENSFGVIGTTMGNKLAGIRGLGNDNSYGVIGITNAANLAGVKGEGNTNSVGVRGTSGDFDGVQGESNSSHGVYGKSEAEIQELLLPGLIGMGTNSKAGVYGRAQKAYGVWGSSSDVSGVFGLSSSSNGVTGGSFSSDTDQNAGVYGASKSTNGVLGWSENATGVYGKSTSGNAGQFDGEVHINNGNKPAKLKIETMEDDKTAPCLVWSGDQYVRKRECWIIEEEGEESYFVSTKGIKIKSGENVVFQVNADGTSVHEGLERFNAGLTVPVNDHVVLRMLPNDGIAVINETTGDYLWHANTTGDSYAKNSFSTNFLSAQNVSANIKNFKIDHPLDPENKFLIHTSIESDERLNVYSGNVITNKDGVAKVQLPDWFEALNIDYRYQLTVIGKFAQAIIENEIENGVFTIRTNEPNTKVSWQVSGIRNDEWARNNPNVIELAK